MVPSPAQPFDEPTAPMSPYDNPPPAAATGHVLYPIVYDPSQTATALYHHHYATPAQDVYEEERPFPPKYIYKVEQSATLNDELSAAIGMTPVRENGRNLVQHDDDDIDDYQFWKSGDGLR